MKSDFRAYAVQHLRIGSQHIDRFISRMENRFIPTAMTPYITEERQLNVAQMDVFSRLMMDRIIFLGDAVDDKIANIIQAQLLFLQSADAKRDIQLYINSPGGSVYAGLGIYDTMQYISPDVATICTGTALSMSAVLLSAGAHVPVIPLFEVVGSGDKVAPEQIGATAVNVGVTFGLTVIVKVAVVAH